MWGGRERTAYVEPGWDCSTEPCFWSQNMVDFIYRLWVDCYTESIYFPQVIFSYLFFCGVNIVFWSHSIK